MPTDEISRHHHSTAIPSHLAWTFFVGRVPDGNTLKRKVREFNPLGLWGWLGDGGKEGKKEGVKEIPLFGERAKIGFFGDM